MLPEWWVSGTEPVPSPRSLNVLCIPGTKKSEKPNFILHIWRKAKLITNVSNEIPEVKPPQESPNLPPVHSLRNREKCRAFNKNNRKLVYELTPLISTLPNVLKG